MVNRLLEAESLLDVTAFLRAAGNSDGTGPGLASELSDQRTDASARRGHDHRFPRRGRGYLTQPDIGCETCEPEYPKPRCRRDYVRVQLANILAVRQRQRTPSGPGENDIARLKLRMTRDNHASDALSDHHVADFKMGGIRLDRFHPRSHVRLERQILRFKQDLILARFGDGQCLEPKVALLDAAVGVGRQYYAPRNSLSHCLLLGLNKSTLRDTVFIP
jgi:hypothetical protein